MVDYKLKNTMAANKFFVVKRSEIENRLDPIFYNSDLNKFNKYFESVKLSKVVKVFKSGVGAGKQDQADGSNGIIQIRPTNIDNYGNLKFDKNIYVPFGFKGDQLSINDVLFNNTNSQELVGKTAILKEGGELFYSNHITKIQVDTEFILPEYLWIVLNIYQENKIFYSLCTNWNNQSGVGLDLLRSLPIPKPPKEIQQQIIDIYALAYNEKHDKEVEAQGLLSSVDTYLFDELGIELPEKENTLESRIFTTQFSELCGERMDPKLYDSTTKGLIASINNIDQSKFKLIGLKDVVIDSIAGDWGCEDIGENIEGFSRCLVIRATEFDNDFNLKLKNSRVKYRLIRNSKLSKLDVKEGDLLIEKSGGSPDQPVGRIALITNDELKSNDNLAYSNFIHKIRVDDTIINPSYLFSFLKTIHNIKLTEAMQSQTNGIRNLIMNSYYRQNIVLPLDNKGEIDLEKQREIADHIQCLRIKAKTQRNKAKAILKEAKEKVEDIILGKEIN